MADCWTGQVQKEIKRRKLLEFAIDHVLDTQFYFAKNGYPKIRVKRGIVHQAVADTLNVTLNNELCLEVNKRVSAMGGTPYICRGHLYFKGVEVWTPSR